MRLANEIYLYIPDLLLKTNLVRSLSYFDSLIMFLLICSWLIEVNASPSLTASSQSDYELKCRLLEDMLHITDMENR